MSQTTQVFQHTRGHLKTQAASSVLSTLAKVYTRFLCNKNQLDALISQIYFGMKLYTFRTVPLSTIRSLFAVHSAMVYVIQICRQLLSRTRMVLLESCMTYTIAKCTVNKLLMMDRGTV